MNPVLVEILRGGVRESRHRGAIAIADDRGRVVSYIGDADAPVFPRSAVKPFQAIPLLGSGAADAWALGEAEIALACGSHGGTERHVATAESLLAKAGSEAAELECGAHWPLDEDAARTLAARGGRPTPLHNNCSGKHAGFIALARHHGWATQGYVHAEHPVMRSVTAALGLVMDCRPDDGPMGIDGCSIPTFAIPLVALARGWARFGTGVSLPHDVAAAAASLRAAMIAQPEMLANAGRFDTEVTRAGCGAVIVKSGAEGVACACLPSLGLGVAVKIDDGAGRAAQAALAACLTGCLKGRGLSEPLAVVLDRSTHAPLTNWNGLEVGALRPTAVLAFSGMAG